MTIAIVRLAATALLLSALSVMAQTTLDVSKITCQQYVLLKVADPEKLALWLSGYHHAKRGDTTIDVQLLQEQPNNLKNYCLYKDADATLMNAVEKLIAEGRSGR